MNQKNPRKTPRAQWIDYDGGTFFITICTHNQAHFFGKIMNGEMILSQIGEIVEFELSNPGLHHPEIQIPLFVVMPNHLHAIIRVNVDISHDIPINQRNPNPALRGNADMARHVPTLSKYIASFKSSVTKQARPINPDFGWQSRYHDHLIRGNKDGNRIADYIINNPQNWDKDCFSN